MITVSKGGCCAAAEAAPGVAAFDEAELAGDDAADGPGSAAWVALDSLLATEGAAPAPVLFTVEPDLPKVLQALSAKVIKMAKNKGCGNAMGRVQGDADRIMGWDHTTAQPWPWRGTPKKKPG